TGVGVAQDMAEAVKWYRRAAEQGDVQAEVALAQACASGQGAPQDLAEAYVWLSQAMAHGNKDAEEERDNLLAKMTPELIFEARKRNAEKGDKEDQYAV